MSTWLRTKCLASVFPEVEKNNLNLIFKAVMTNKGTSCQIFGATPGSEGLANSSWALMLKATWRHLQVDALEAKWVGLQESELCTQT